MTDAKLEAGKRNDAVKALTRRAWLDEPKAEELVGFAVRGATEQALDLITGVTFIPTTMTSMRAERLYYICRAAKRWLSQREVEVLFRVTPAGARAIMGTAQATYEGNLSDYLIADMRTKVQVRQVGSANDPRIRLRCLDASGFNTLMNEVHRLGLDNEGDEGPGRYEMTFPEQVSVQGTKRSALEWLGIPKPSDWRDR